MNIPISDTAYDATTVCPNDQCIIAQVERFSRTLANPAINFKKRQKALKYLIHFVADLHQPLHAGDNHDRGGNDVQVEFLGQSINPFNQKPWNLHAVWDSAIVEHYVQASKLVVDHQLIKAGVRLAKVLNQALSKRQRPDLLAGGQK